MFNLFNFSGAFSLAPSAEDIPTCEDAFPQPCDWDPIHKLCNCGGD